MLEVFIHWLSLLEDKIDDVLDSYRLEEAEKLIKCDDSRLINECHASNVNDAICLLLLTVQDWRHLII